MHLKNYALRKVKSINNLGWSTSVSWRKNEYLRLCGQANALLSCYHLSMESAHRVRDVSCACFRHLSVSDDCTPVSLPAPFQFWMLHQHWFSWHLLAAEPISGPSSDWTMNPNSIELLPLSPSLTLFLSTIGTTEHMLSSVAFQCLQFTNQIRRWWVCAKLALTCSSPNVPPPCIASLLTWTTKTGEHHPRPICYTWHT